MDRFADVLDQLTLENEVREDLVLPLSDFKMRDDGLLFNDDYGELELSDMAFNSLASIFGLNRKHLKLLMNEGLTDNVAYQLNHFLSSTSQQKKFRVVEGRIKGIVNPNFTTYDDYRLFETIGEMRNQIPEMQLNDFYRDDKRTHARFVLEDTNRIVGLDSEEDGSPDNVQIGFDVTNSEIGYGKLEIAPMILRLVCTNGLRRPMTTGERFNQQHSNFTNFDIDRNIGDWIETSVKDSSSDIVRMMKSRDVKVDDPYEEIERIGKEEKINKSEIARIQDIFDIEPQENMFGVINSFTRYGREIEEIHQDNERRVVMENIAGKILERV